MEIDRKVLERWVTSTGTGLHQRGNFSASEARELLFQEDCREAIEATRDRGQRSLTYADRS